jgi:hypothetical protein
LPDVDLVQNSEDLGLEDEERGEDESEEQADDAAGGEYGLALGREGCLGLRGA